MGFVSGHCKDFSYFQAQFCKIYLRRTGQFNTGYITIMFITSFHIIISILCTFTFTFPI